MDEERLTPVWKIGCGLAALCIAAVVGWLLFTMSVVTHDKSVNTSLQIMWNAPRGVPLGTVVPANNRWMENAFVADASKDDHKPFAVLILDDHYRSGDYSLRSESGVIGDNISREVLCSVPAQAKGKKTTLDPVVQQLIVSVCSRVR